MTYGYLGDTSSIKQSKKNAGILSVNEALILSSQGHLGDAYTLVASASADNSSQLLTFDDCFTSEYGSYYITWADYVPANDENLLYFRFKNASGEVDGGSAYQYCNFYLQHSGGSGEYKSTGANHIKIMGGAGTGTGEIAHGHINVYSPANSERTAASTSSVQYDQNAVMHTMFGGGMYDTAEAVTGCLFRSISSGGTLGNINTLDVNIYGIKHL